MGIKNFFENAFSDMKDNAKEQHKVDKANLEAVKAESKANFEIAKAMGNPEKRKAMMQKERKKQISEAEARKFEAEAVIKNLKD